jgi:hypothetical protein
MSKGVLLAPAERVNPKKNKEMMKELEIRDIKFLL